MVDAMDNFDLSPPLDLSHHFSDISKHRQPSAIKGFYKYFSIPNIGNLAGGLPNPGYFPFDTLEASTAVSTRFNPTSVSDSNNPVSPKQSSKSKDRPVPSLNDPTPRHILVPHDSKLPSKLDRIDISTALQYGTATGYPPLATFIRQFALSHLHPNIPYKNGAETVLTCGNTDGFAKAIEGFTDLWSTTCGRPQSERQGLLCEEYAYMNAIQTARPRGLNIVPIAIDAEGMLAYGHKRCLYNVLNDWNVERDGGRRPHIMYTVTMGQNPTSGLLSVKRRKEIYEVCQKFDIIIVEDDPYYYIQFPHVANELTQKWRNGELASANHFAESEINYQTSLAVPVRGTIEQNGHSYRTTRMRKGVSSGYPFLDSLVPSFLSLDIDGRVIRLDTFSKTVAPGCRLGWITAQPAFIDVLLRVTEVSTQQPSGFVQSMVAELLIGPDHKELYEDIKKNKKRGEQSSAGWKMDGWVRWLEGLRGNYERRMRIMAQVFEEGKTTIMTSQKEVTMERKKLPNRVAYRSREDPRVAAWSQTRSRLPPSPEYTTSTSTSPSEQSDSSDSEPFEHLSKTALYDFTIPQAGMFFWIHMNFPAHPLANSSKFSHPELSQAFWVFQTRKPYLVLTAPGTIFAPTEQIRLDSAWQYFRICFAAVDEADVKALSERFVSAARDFWEVDDESFIRELLDDAADPSSLVAGGEEGLLGMAPHMC